MKTYKFYSLILLFSMMNILFSNNSRAVKISSVQTKAETLLNDNEDITAQRLSSVIQAINVPETNPYMVKVHRNPNYAQDVIKKNCQQMKQYLNGEDEERDGPPLPQVAGKLSQLLKVIESNKADLLAIPLSYLLEAINSQY